MKKTIHLFWLLGLIIFLPLAMRAQEELEPYTYFENFETRELLAWASYPLWQDTAFDPNFRVNTMVPGDSNISIVERVTPYSNVDTYAGAQKKLDMYLIPGSVIRLRYYLKTQLSAEFLKVRLAAGPEGALDLTVRFPVTNRWTWLETAYDDFVKDYPRLREKRIKVNALAVLAKFPKADPAMPIYFGLDDISVKGARSVHFRFTSPVMYKLAEWKPYISQKHYRAGDTLAIRGSWPLAATRVKLDIAPYTDPSRKVLQTELAAGGKEWTKSIPLRFPLGLYQGTLKAFQGERKLSETEFTFVVAPEEIGGRHPRIWFDAAEKKEFLERFRAPRFKSLAEEIRKQAGESREKNRIEKLVFDIDQFPDDEPLIGNVPRSIYSWSERINGWQTSVFSNAEAYGLLQDRAAGVYAKDYLVKVCSFPFWVHPWFEKRGQHIYYPVGLLGAKFAIAYDLLYDLMTPAERGQVREALMRNIVVPAHQGYVVGNTVSTNTSNWVGHVTGGSVLCQAAMYGDGPEVALPEPYFSGVVFKHFEQIERSSGRDGGYGEGWGYYAFSMSSWAESIPAFRKVFHIDMTGRIDGSYTEAIWGGLVQDKKFFYYGDSSGDLSPIFSWAWLLEKNRDPLLAWFYFHLKKDETMMDVLHPVEKISRRDPFQENPDRVYRDVGTTVFKSGWSKEDFSFSLRTGAFFNHQHLDQGTFWLADRGNIFIGERHGSTYYDDPFYQSNYTQPVGHSTILIDGNGQSQRVGDPLEFAEGFGDHAFIGHFLDGADTAFSSGDIGRLYWGKVKELQRNVLFLKPRTLLMLDTVIPAENDVDVTLLYQTEFLKDIRAGAGESTITKNGTALHIVHLYPRNSAARAVETPHYIGTLKNVPLEREGMLTLTARTDKKPLVMANLLTTSADSAGIQWQSGEGCMNGRMGSREVAFSTEPGKMFACGGIKTDALAVSVDGNRWFAALCRRLEKDGKAVFTAERPVTCENSENGFAYFAASSTPVLIAIPGRPSAVKINGKAVRFTFLEKEGAIRVALDPGTGRVEVK